MKNADDRLGDVLGMVTADCRGRYCGAPCPRQGRSTETTLHPFRRCRPGMADAFVCAPASDVVSSLRETLCAVKANSLTVEVGVLEDVLYKGAVLLRLAESPWVRDVGGELGECLLSDRLHDRCAH